VRTAGTVDNLSAGAARIRVRVMRAVDLLAAPRGAPAPQARRNVCDQPRFQPTALPGRRPRLSSDLVAPLRVAGDFIAA
jgi:hypothetical protein